MAFPIKALQVDGGGEFQAAFEEACQERGLVKGIYNTVRPHQVLDGRTPAEYLKEHHPEVAHLSHMQWASTRH